MSMKITLPGNRKVAAEFQGFTVMTDQPEEYGGDNTAPAPLDYFFVSLGTCAGFYVLRFCQQRDIQTNAISLELDYERDTESKTITAVEIAILLPDDFPAKYRTAVVRAAEQCTVKKILANPPDISVKTKV